MGTPGEHFLTRGAKFCDDLLTLQEAAFELGVSTKTLRRMIQAGELTIVMLHKSKRIRRQDLQACLTETKSRRK